MKASLLFCTALVLHRLIPNVNSVQLPPNKSPCPFMSTSCPLFLDGPVESLHLEGKWQELRSRKKTLGTNMIMISVIWCYMFSIVCVSLINAYDILGSSWVIKSGSSYFFGWTTWSTGVRVGCIGSSMDCPTSKCVDPGTLGVRIYS